jgi:PAS domain S-box-containing protein
MARVKSMQGYSAQWPAPPGGRPTLLKYSAYGAIALTLLTLICFQLRFDLATTAFLYLIVIVLLSLNGSFLLSAVLSLMAVGCLAYFFAPPLFSFEIADPREGVAIPAFLITSAVITRLVATVRKSADDAISADASQREQAGLLNLTHDSVFVRDTNDVITFWNRGAEEQYGWMEEEALGHVTHELLQTVFPAPLDEITGVLTRTGRWEGELVHTRRDGTRIVVASRWALQLDPQGRPLAVLETNNDITRSRQAEQAMRQQANLLEQSHDAIFVWEFPRTIVYWNRGAEDLYGFSREEAIGRLSHQLLQTQHPTVTPDFEAALERDGEWTGELTHTTRDGRRIIVESRHVLMPEADGRRLVLETNRDITERKRVEQALEELAGRLIHAQEAERSRIGRELHDHISQTLGVLTIKIDQLRADAAIAPGLAGALEELRQDTSAITDDVHRLSHRLHSSTLDYLGLLPALQKLVAEFSGRHGIPIAFAHASMPATLPSEVALCLFRVAEESLTNVAKHSNATSARVHVAGTPDGIHLTVEDVGEGFDMKSVGSKAGLGFVSMQERLRILQGTIRVDSAPSRGTRIDVWVPSKSLVIPAAKQARTSAGQSPQA